MFTDIEGFSKILVRYMLLKRKRFLIFTRERILNAVKINNFVFIRRYVAGTWFLAYKLKNVF
jgi:hypothetical protein